MKKKTDKDFFKTIDKGEIDGVVDRLMSDFEFFSKTMLRITPSPKQLELVNAFEAHEHVEGIFNRQGGKSTILAAYDTWKLVTGGKDTVIDLFAPILDQTDIVAGKLRATIRSNPILMRFTKEFARHHILMNNGAEFTARSASEQSHIRGHSPTIIQIDESQDITDRKYYEDILPSGSATGAKVQEIGTTTGRNHFYRNTMNRNVATVYQHWKDCPFTDLRYIKRMRKTMPQERFNREFCNIFDVDFGMAFPYEPLQAAFDVEPEVIDPENTGEYYLGIDFGKHEDETVVIVLSKKIEKGVAHYYQVNMDRWLKEGYDDVMEEVKENFFEVYNPETAFGDKTGVGEGVMDMFPEKYGLEAKDLNNEDKEELADLFNMILAEGRVHLWDDFDLRTQFEQWERVKLKSGKNRFHHPSGGHDDIVIAVLLAIQAGEEGIGNVDYSEGISRVSSPFVTGHNHGILARRDNLDLFNYR